MPLLSKGKMFQNHKIEGIGDDFIPDLIDKSIIDEVILVNDDDAINMVRILSNKLGLGVGVSSGANFIASALIDRDNVVTVFPDDFKKYLSTDLGIEVDDNENFVSNNIELLSLEIVE